MFVPTTLDLANLTDAELGRIVRAGMLALTAERAEPVRAQVAATRKAREQADAELLHAARAARSDADVLAAFCVGTLTVPALDTAAAESGEIAPAKARSPYNKARYRLKAGAGLGTDATWAQLAAEHVALAALAGSVTEPVTEIVAEPVEPVAQLAAPLNPADAAKIAAIVTATGVDEARARQLFASLG